MAEYIGKSLTLGDSSSEQVGALPFAIARSHEDNGIQAFDRPAASPHFQGFLAFVDKYLGKQVLLYGRSRQGMEQDIAFENLWMLFDGNDTICSPLREGRGDGKVSQWPRGLAFTAQSSGIPPQAYQVIATSGGMSFVKTMTSTFGSGEIDEPTNPTLSVVHSWKPSPRLRTLPTYRCR
ncbi:hypothetical protein F4776DRAFT_220296 [Hypoxylon sp. NC0597]|nr:hypothetical protein F4776DRAFT_220296 [Hypoxylon sp. NC0597]